MENLLIKNMYDLNETIAADLFEGLDYPWQALPNIGDFIKKLGPSLPKEEYDQIGEDVWIAKSATYYQVFPLKRLKKWKTGNHTEYRVRVPPTQVL